LIAVRANDQYYYRIQPPMMMQTATACRFSAIPIQRRGLAVKTRAVRPTGVTVSDVKSADGGRMVVEVDGQKVRVVKSRPVREVETRALTTGRPDTCRCSSRPTAARSTRCRTSVPIWGSGT